jgi:hypothetical protein
MAKIKLTSIKCNVPDEIDKDEMFLKYNGEKIWPSDAMFFRMDVDQKVSLEHVMEVPEGEVEIQLWDFDYASLNDHLGSFIFKVDQEYGKFTCSMKANTKETKSASYFLQWEILD